MIALSKLEPTSEIFVDKDGFAFNIEGIDNEYFLEETGCELREYDDSMESGNFRRVVTIGASKMTW
jgi:hypothetical protein